MTHFAPEQFDLYLDNLLEPAERAAADAHLLVCSACQNELISLRDMIAALEALPPDRLPADLTGPVLARIASAPRPWPARLAQTALATQAVIVLALSAWLVPPLLDWPLPLVGPTLPAWLEEGPTPTIPPELAALARAGIAPLDALGLWQWGLILTLAGAAWLVTNRLLLQGLMRSRRSERGLSR